jgi:hypothetical protein
VFRPCPRPHMSQLSSRLVSCQKRPHKPRPIGRDPIPIRLSPETHRLGCELRNQHYESAVRRPGSPAVAADAICPNQQRTEREHAHNRNAMTIFRSAEISFILQSLHACTKYLLDKSRTAGRFSFANAFHRARGISPSRGVMTARFRPMEKVEVAAGNSRRMEARLSHWHNGYARRSSRLGGAVSTECAREHLRTSANSWQHAEVRGN